MATLTYKLKKRLIWTTKKLNAQVVGMEQLLNKNLLNHYYKTIISIVATLNFMLNNYLKNNYSLIVFNESLCTLKNLIFLKRLCNGHWCCV